MQRLEVSGAVRPLQSSLGVKGLIIFRGWHTEPTKEIFPSAIFCIRHAIVTVRSRTIKLLRCLALLHSRVVQINVTEFIRLSVFLCLCIHITVQA